MPKFNVKLEIPSTTTVELLVTADNAAQARELGRNYLKEVDSVEECSEETGSTDGQFAMREVVQVSEIK